MPPFFIRSTIFNLCFYILTSISCILLLPTLVLPNKFFLAIVKGFSHVTTLLEKYILGLTYEVRGIENLPKEGAYIVAAKHQSAYETFKLHILFNNPAIVLKKELLKIPLWGKYLAKSDVIAIDRSSPKTAIKSIREEARRVAAQKRPIIIFPQGTRVTPDTTTKEKPYKIGVVRMQEATGLPIIPLALNTGVFYPKSKWCKKAGRVIFEFLPPINPSDDASEILKKIEESIEKKSKKLVEEGRKTIPTNKTENNYKLITTIMLFLAIAYTISWFVSANITKKIVSNYIENLKNNPQISEYKLSDPKIYGFPWKIKLELKNQFIKTNMGLGINIGSIKAKSAILLGMPIDVNAVNISFSIDQWKKPIKFDRLDSQFTFEDNILNIKYAHLIKDKAQGKLSGYINLSPKNKYPVISLDLKIVNIKSIIHHLNDAKIIRPKEAMLASMFIKSLENDDGIIDSSITSQNNKIYLGPMKVFELPAVTNK